MRHRRFISLLATGLLLAGGVRAYAEAMAHWTFDNYFDKEKETWGDTVGPNGHLATPQNKGSLKFVEGDTPFGKAAEFTGNNGNSLEINPLLIQSRSFTVLTWFRLNSAGLNPFLSDWQKNELGYFFGVDNARNGKPTLTTELRSAELRPGANGRPSTSPFQIVRVQRGEVKLNEWQHAAFVWERTGAQQATMTLYLNGDEVATQNVKVGGNNQPKSVNIKPGKNVRLGGRADGDATLKGALDETWVFNEALAAEQVKNMMRTNNTRGEGAIAKVLIKKEDPKTEPTAVAVGPTTPPTGDNKTENVVPPANTNANPTPAVTPTPTQGSTGTQITANNNATDPGEEPQTPETPNPTPAAIATPANSAPPVVAVTPATSTPAVAEASPRLPKPVVAAQLPSRYTPARLTGIVTCFTISAFLGAYLFWAMGERAKLKPVHA